MQTEPCRGTSCQPLPVAALWSFVWDHSSHSNSSPLLEDIPLDICNLFFVPWQDLWCAVRFLTSSVFDLRPEPARASFASAQHETKFVLSVFPALPFIVNPGRSSAPAYPLRRSSRQGNARIQSAGSFFNRVPWQNALLSASTRKTLCHLRLPFLLINDPILRAGFWACIASLVPPCPAHNGVAGCYRSRGTQRRRAAPGFVGKGLADETLPGKGSVEAHALSLGAGEAAPGHGAPGYPVPSSKLPSG